MTRRVLGLLLLAYGCTAPTSDDAGARDATAPPLDATAPPVDAGSVADAAPPLDAPSTPMTDAATRDASTGAGGCEAPDPSWLFCEDFEAGGGDFDAWLASSAFLQADGGDDRGRLDLSSDAPHSGAWSMHMPASPASGYRGGSLDWWACEGGPSTGCPLESHERLYVRAFIRFAEDHRYVHHFLAVGGSQPDDFWYHGTAGCLPNGELAMGTTVDHHPLTHESFFYSYSPDMRCDTSCDRYADVDRICADCAARGLPTCTEQPQCCWGNELEPATPRPFPLGRWFCFEMTMEANTPGVADGSMAYWIDGELGHEVGSMRFRESPTLALNRARLQHYITSSDADGHSNRVWFDDVVVSTEPIGCARF